MNHTLNNHMPVSHCLFITPPTNAQPSPYHHTITIMDSWSHMDQRDVVTLIKASGTTITLEDIGVRVCVLMCVLEECVCAGVGMCVYGWVRAFL